MPTASRDHAIELETVLGVERSYCEAVDDKEPARIAALFRPDGELRYKGNVVKGRDDIESFYRDFFVTAPDWWRHWTMNPRLERANNEVHVFLDLLALMVTSDGLQLANSVYSDVLVLSNGHLKFRIKEILPKGRFTVPGGML